MQPVAGLVCIAALAPNVSKSVAELIA